MQIGEDAFCSSLEEEQLEKLPLNAPQVNHLLIVAALRELWLLFKHYSKFVEKFMFREPRTEEGEPTFHIKKVALSFFLCNRMPQVG